jgi:superfamily II DNA or RNA helicase
MIVPIFVRERLYVPRFPDIEEVLAELRSKFTYHNPDYQKRKRLKLWTGSTDPNLKTWKHVEHPDWGPCLSLPRGGTQKLRDVFNSYEGVGLSFTDRRLSMPPVKGFHNNVILRDDQMRLAKAMFQVENCLIRSPQGSGKTETALKVVEWILQVAGPVLIVVWETGLLDQWVSRIMQRFGLRKRDVGELSGKRKHIAPITVGMQQTLNNRGYKYANVFGGLIADEVQRFAANTYQKVIDIFPAKYRIGISADETRSDKKQFLIYDAFGQVADEIEQSKLVEAGEIHEVIVRIIPTEFDFEAIIPVLDKEGRETMKSVPWFELPPEYRDFDALLNELCFNTDRNDLIWEFMEPNLKAGHTLQVVTLRRLHAEYWVNRIRRAGYNVGLMLGGTKNRIEFDDTIEGLKRGTIQGGVGTIQKSGIGLDVPGWNRGFILAPSANNKQNMRQITGRLSRLSTDTQKTEAVCYYFWDQYCYPQNKADLKRLYPQTFIWRNGEFLPVT